MVVELVTAEHSRGSVVKPGQREEGRDTSALCRLASSPGLRVGLRGGVPERPLSTLLPFLGRELGCFPCLCDKPGWQAFWGQLCGCQRKGEKQQPVSLCAVSWGLVERWLPGPELRVLLTWAVCTWCRKLCHPEDLCAVDL